MTLPVSKPILLLTRPKAQAELFLAELSRDLGHAPEAIIDPLVEIEHLAIGPIDRARPILVTSANAVRAAYAAGFTPNAGGYAVGQSVLDATKHAGWENITLAGATISKALPNLAGGLTYLRGTIITKDLRGLIADLSEVVVYSQRAKPLSHATLEILVTRPQIAPVFSPFAAKALLKALPKEAQTTIAAISPAVAQEFDPDRFTKISIASEPDKTAMLALVSSLLSSS